MSADLDDSPRAAPVVSAGRHRRRAWILLAIGVWNLWVWITRIRNLVADGAANTFAFNAVHAVLYVGSIALAVVLCVMGVRMLRESRGA